MATNDTGAKLTALRGFFLSEVNSPPVKRDAYPSVAGASLESRSKLCRSIGTCSRVVEHFLKA